LWTKRWKSWALLELNLFFQCLGKQEHFMTMTVLSYLSTQNVDKPMENILITENFAIKTATWGSGSKTAHAGLQLLHCIRPRNLTLATLYCYHFPLILYAAPTLARRFQSLARRTKTGILTA
jgi:hypothetical protein